MAGTKTVPVLRITGESASEAEAAVVEEASLTVVLNGRELATLLCSPGDAQYLAAGFIQSLGLIRSKDDIEDMACEGPGVVSIRTKGSVMAPAEHVLSSSGGKGRHPAQKVTSGARMKLPAAIVFALMSDFEQRSETFRATGGVHSAALCRAGSMLVFNEDIGRHNAIDKVFGQCLLQGTPTDDTLLLTSGRVSSEILLKAAARDVPVIVSRNAPTDLAVSLAQDLGMTAVGFVRGNDMTVYANNWRVVN